MSDLKPCPFCGGKADPSGWMNGYGQQGPECETCGATAQCEGYWNRRHPTAWCACGDSHTSESVCANCLAAESDGAPEIGTRYRNDAGEVVAVVVPCGKLRQLKDSISGDCYMGEEWERATIEAMLAALPEPD